MEGGSFTAEVVEKPLGQVEHSWKDPTEHLTDSAPQLVTLHSESTSVCVRVCVGECVYECVGEQG